MGASQNVIVEQSEMCSPAPVGIRVLILECCSNDVHFGLGLLQSDVGFKPAYDVKKVISPGRILGIKSERHPYVYPRGECKPWRRDPYYGARAAVDRQRLANYAPVKAKHALPQSIAYDYTGPGP